MVFHPVEVSDTSSRPVDDMNLASRPLDKQVISEDQPTLSCTSRVRNTPQCLQQTQRYINGAGCLMITLGLRRRPPFLAMLVVTD